MFGYVNIDKAELKFKEYYKYKGFYCGLCMNLKHNYSEISRLALNYDMTFLILLLSSLYETNDNAIKKNCIAHPFKKQIIIDNEITDYVAAMNVILAYYNCIDNWKDEHDLKSYTFSKLIQKSFLKAQSLYKSKDLYIQKSLDNLQKLENEGSSDIDAVANEFGNIMAELMVYKSDHWEKMLRKVGFYLGRYIYILDAYLDYDEDKKNGSYNPFLKQKFENREEFDQKIKNILMLELAFLDDAIDRLPLIKDKGIIDNIIYSGIQNKLKKQENINYEG